MSLTVVPRTEDETPAPVALPEELRFVLESKVVTEQPPQTSDGSTPDSLAPSRYEHGLWRAGWTDGRLGQTPEPQLQLVASQGKLTRSHRTADVKKKLADTQAEEKHKRFISEQRTKEWDDIRAEYDRIVADRRRNAVGYSKLLGLVYLAFGIGIFIADMPLSLKVAPALGVDVRRQVGGQAVSADNLSDLFRYFGALWEPAAVAVGIAALTIAFKIVIDKVHKPYQFETWWSRLLGALLMIMTIGAAIWAFVLIGQARAAYEGAAVPANRAWLFTILAIMFPVVCGYCFSMARSSWQNVSHYSRVAKEHDAAWTRLVESNLALERAAASAASAQAELDGVEKDTVEEDFLKNLYLHGYQRGRCVPQTSDQDASLYDRCEILLHYWLAQLPQMSHEAAERQI